MNLTSAQKTALKAHMALNTNTTNIVGAGGSTFVINTRLATLDPSDEGAIAEWYNSNAKAGDQQPFANRFVWQENVTLKMLNAATKWQTEFAGTGDAQIGNNILRWQTMIWNNSIDMSDGSVRKGVTTVFGDVAGGSAAAIGASGCGQRVGMNVELALAGNVTGASAGGALTDAHVCAKDAAGASLQNQRISQTDVDTVLREG